MPAAKLFRPTVLAGVLVLALGGSVVEAQAPSAEQPPTPPHPFVKEGPWVTYGAKTGPGHGRHIVFVTGDEEYRSEESMPALAKILSERHGFHTTVLFAINKKTGEIDPMTQDNIPGLDALTTADLMVVFLRFRKLPDAEMAKFVEYVESGRPVIGIRTATHAFDYDSDQGNLHAKWAWRGPHENFRGGFGRQVLGETWIDHYGGYRSEGTRGVIPPEMKSHPILRGCDDIWGPSHAYKVTELQGDAQPLVLGQPLRGHAPSDPPNTDKKPIPVAWIKSYTGGGGKKSRVFTTTYGYGDDFKYEGIRRLLVNSCYWCVGLEDRIPPRSNVELIGEYAPLKSNHDGHRRGVKPRDLRLGD